MGNLNGSSFHFEIASSTTTRTAFNWSSRTTANALVSSRLGSGRGWPQGPRTKIGGLLKEAGLTVARLSEATRQQHGKNTRYFIPPAFLYKLAHGISPHICQIAALSEITGHPFSDCLEACGFDLRLILPLQVKMHGERTTLLTPTGSVCSPRMLSGSHCQVSGGQRYLFAKLGRLDAASCFELVPGSVIRIDRHYSRERLKERDVNAPLWLVEHAHGLTCCHVKQTDEEHIVLLPNRPPFSGWPLRLATEARILGLVDMQIRPAKAPRSQPVRAARYRDWVPLSNRETRTSLSRLLQMSRYRAGLTLRAAREMTLRLASILGRREYSIALGLLSDYEAMEKLPRCPAKIISLCIVYNIDFWELMRVAGIGIDQSGKAIVSSALARKLAQERIALGKTPDGTLGSIPSTFVD